MFVSSAPHSSGAVIQADLNAAANIGLRALMDPDFAGKWWYVPCDPKTKIPKADKVKGGLVDGVGPLAPVSVDNQTQKKKAAKEKTREVVNLCATRRQTRSSARSLATSGRRPRHIGMEFRPEWWLHSEAERPSWRSARRMFHSECRNRLILSYVPLVGILIQAAKGGVISAYVSSPSMWLWHAGSIFENRVGGASAPVVTGESGIARGPLPAMSYPRFFQAMNAIGPLNFVHARLTACKCRLNQSLRVRRSAPRRGNDRLTQCPLATSTCSDRRERPPDAVMIG